MNRHFMLKRKTQCKIWRLEKEKLFPESIQQTNTGDGGNVDIWGGISGFGATAAKIYMAKIWMENCTQTDKIKKKNGEIHVEILTTIKSSKPHISTILFPLASLRY
ncbi:unnamed protein product [Rotaria socialis]|uniref:Uncharacterized protein n=1 Tax=Rotaria socialis TaxID=392032 RepID=A0A818I1V4_9BILA|nr:unnamed protein product [Rotaria socialis]CAF4672150.1 unnamed protein product [Rotaria socialis]